MSTGVQQTKERTQETGATQNDMTGSSFRGASMPEPSGADFVELKYRSVDNMKSASLARGLGYFSIALGLAEIFAPNRVGEMAGVAKSFRSFLPALGMREVAHGLGILMSNDPTTAVWTRVGGDALDLAYVGAAFVSDDSNKRRLVGTSVALLGAAAMDLMCANKLSSQEWKEQAGNPKAPTTIGQTSGRRSFESR